MAPVHAIGLCIVVSLVLGTAHGFELKRARDLVEKGQLFERKGEFWVHPLDVAHDRSRFTELFRSKTQLAHGLVGSPDTTGIYTTDFSGATKLYFRRGSNGWEWAPTKDSSWQRVTQSKRLTAPYQGESPFWKNMGVLAGLAAEDAFESGGRSAGKKSSVKGAFRGFISTALTGGFWLDAQCGTGSGAVHEYVGKVPRIANPSGDECFRTDSRAYSTDFGARARATFKATLENGVGTVIQAYSDTTKFFNCAGGGIVASVTEVLGGPSSACGTELCSKNAPASQYSTPNEFKFCYSANTKAWSSSCGSEVAIIAFGFWGLPSDPCTPPGTPKIDIKGGMALSQSGRVDLTVAVDDFPWFEGVKMVDGVGTSLFTLDPVPGATVFSLAGGANRFVESH